MIGEMEEHNWMYNTHARARAHMHPFIHIYSKYERMIENKKLRYRNKKN